MSFDLSTHADLIVDVKDWILLRELSSRKLFSAYAVLL